MSQVPTPSALSSEPTGETSVRVRWLGADGVDGYEMRSGESPIIRTIPPTARSIEIKGLRPARNDIVEMRATLRGLYSDWVSVSVRPSVSIPIAPTSGAGVIQVIDADRQSIQLRLPTPTGDLAEVRLTLWWQPSDIGGGWWGGLEVPTNTWAVRSRSLALNCGILDDVAGILAGNFVMRSTQDGGTEEPDRMAFVNRTHELRWEPT